MIAFLLLLIPLITGVAAFIIKKQQLVKSWAILSSLITMVVAIYAAVKAPESSLSYNDSWLSLLGASFALKLDGLGLILVLLTAIAFPVIFIATYNTTYKKSSAYYGLMLLAQAGLMGVFLAYDVLLFYFFWELALIPVYFLCSGWGGEKRIPVTFKFFVYTFLGSLLMLAAILYVYSFTPDKSFSMASFYNVQIPYHSQAWLFWLFFVAFAIKMPVFPFHTWQPDTYEQSPTGTTMVLSGLMVKMGVFGVMRWLLPVLSMPAYAWGDTVSSMAVIGMLYGSLMAMKQDDIKRLVAYSSMAHIGLMALTLFAETEIGYQGVMIQMFNHGINIIGLWICVEIIERNLGTRKFSELGGLAQKAPALTVFFVIIAFANIALPLTSGFPGEFLMFTGIYTSQVTNYNVIFTVLAGLCIILGAVYTLNMIRKIFFGNTTEKTAGAKDISLNEKLVLTAVVVIILWLGIFPQSMLDLTEAASKALFKEADVTHLLTK